jgi:hypothetical protein
MKCICDTATAVITAPRGHNSRLISANIKIFGAAEDKPDEIVYLPRWRSEFSDKDRDEEDSETRKSEFRVKRNMVYDSIITSAMGQPYCLIADMKKYLEEDMKRENDARKRRGELPYLQPSEAVVGYYQSCMVVPIFGLRAGPGATASAAEKRGRDVMMSFRDGSVLGTLCIDSERAAYFNNQYDLLIMSQLAEHAYSAMTSMKMVADLRSPKKTPPRRPRVRRSGGED